MRVDAILPAGGRIRGEFAREAGVEVKALIRLGEQTLLERAVSALRRIGPMNPIGRIVVIGPEDIGTPNVDAVLPESESGPANLYRGIDWLEGCGMPDRILLLTTDLPFITPESIAGFLNACPPDADLCVPAFRRRDFELRYPAMPAVFVKLRDGEWTTGCAFLLNPAAIRENRKLIDRIFAARKSQIGMARLLGPMMIARFLTRRLEVSHIERRCRQVVGFTGKAVLGCDPALAFDIDLPAEYRYALTHAKQHLGEAA